MSESEPAVVSPFLSTNEAAVYLKYRSASGSRGGSAPRPAGVWPGFHRSRWTLVGTDLPERTTAAELREPGGRDHSSGTRGSNPRLSAWESRRTPSSDGYLRVDTGDDLTPGHPLPTRVDPRVVGTSLGTEDVGGPAMNRAGLSAFALTRLMDNGSRDGANHRR